jgi:hypothetical protein
VLGVRDLGKIRRAGAVLAAQAEALNEARKQQDERRGEADGGVGRRHGDDERAQAHHQHRNGERQTAAVPVGDVAEQPAAEWSHEKADGEDGGGVEELRGGTF